MLEEEEEEEDQEEIKIMKTLRKNWKEKGKRLTVT